MSQKKKDKKRLLKRKKIKDWKAKLKEDRAKETPKLPRVWWPDYPGGTDYPDWWFSLRTPRTTQERRANQGQGYHRGCRNSNNLVHAWDDIFHEYQKPWKKRTKRRHQWRRIYEM